MLSLAEIVKANKLGDQLQAAKDANARADKRARVANSLGNAYKSVTHGEWEARRK